MYEGIFVPMEMSSVLTVSASIHWLCGQLECCKMFPSGETGKGVHGTSISYLTLHVKATSISK